ncbi:MAG: hypothetical protein Q8R24_09285 [Legionellaceae bacterium]|nr:hypothetical protein [Legionellaceae bacterium]
MNDDKLDSPKAIKAFLGGTDKLKFSVPKSNRHEFIAGTPMKAGDKYLSTNSTLSPTTLTTLHPQCLFSCYNNK